LLALLSDSAGGEQSRAENERVEFKGLVSKSIDENIKVNTIKLTAKIALSPDS
jgi:hypothetical protein